MPEQILSYATPQSENRGWTVRDVFGLIVRTLGLILATYGAYGIAFSAVTAIFSFSGGLPTMAIEGFLGGAIELAIGLFLLRGNWILRFAYSPRH